MSVIKTLYYDFYFGGVFSSDVNMSTTEGSKIYNFIPPRTIYWINKFFYFNY